MYRRAKTYAVSRTYQVRCPRGINDGRMSMESLWSTYLDDDDDDDDDDNCCLFVQLYDIKYSNLIIICPVGWGCRIYQLIFYRELRIPQRISWL